MTFGWRAIQTAHVNGVRSGDYRGGKLTPNATLRRQKIQAPAASTNLTEGDGVLSEHVSNQTLTIAVAPVYKMIDHAAPTS